MSQADSRCSVHKLGTLISQALVLLKSGQAGSSCANTVLLVQPGSGAASRAKALIWLMLEHWAVGEGTSAS